MTAQQIVKDQCYVKTNRCQHEMVAIGMHVVVAQYRQQRNSAARRVQVMGELHGKQRERHRQRCSQPNISVAEAPIEAINNGRP
jgi:hypothetical protein